MENESGVKAAVEAGKAAMPLDQRIGQVRGLPVAIGSNGNVAVLKDVLEYERANAPAPDETRGTAVFTELPSFIAHVNRFKDVGSVIFLDTENCLFTAVLDYAASNTAPEWMRHRAAYGCPLSRQWQLWLEKNEEEMSQEEFSELLERNKADLTSGEADSGTPGALLTVARACRIYTSDEVVSDYNPSTGEFNMVAKRENGPMSTKVPAGFSLLLPVFRGADATNYRLTAQLRFRVANGRPRFTYILMNHEETLEDAMAGARAMVATETSLPVWAGSPEQR